MSPIQTARLPYTLEAWPSKRLRQPSLRHRSSPNTDQSPTSSEETALLAAETTAGEHQAQLRTLASDLLSWKGGLKVLHQAQLPKWRGHFKWQIEAQIEALQAAYARLRAECAKPDG